MTPAPRLLHTEFTALLQRCGLTQRAFAQLIGYSPQQVNSWCRGREPLPRWTAFLAVLLTWIQDDFEFCLEDVLANLEDVPIRWHETLGVDADAELTEVRRARGRLAHVLHPDKGGDHELMQRVNRAFEQFSAARRKPAT